MAGNGNRRTIRPRLKRSETPPVCRGVGPLLRHERKRRCWSQEDLAEKSGLSQAAISYLERSVNTPRMETMERLAEALCWEVERLIKAARRRSPTRARLA